MKACRMCGQPKELNLFYNDLSSPDRRKHECKHCIRMFARIRRALKDIDLTPYGKRRVIDILYDKKCLITEAMRRRPVTEDDRKEIINLHASGVNVEEICKIVRRSIRSVLRIIKNNVAETERSRSGKKYEEVDLSLLPDSVLFKEDKKLTTI